MNQSVDNHDEVVRARAAASRRVGRLASYRWFLSLACVSLLAVTGCAAPQQEPPKLGEYIWPLPPEPPRIKLVRILRNENDVGAGEELSVADVLLGKQKKVRIGLKKPYGVHADKDGRVFVADSGWGKVLVFDDANELLSVWGQGGKGQLTKPFGVTSDSQGRVYVTDLAQQRVVVYDSEGEFISAFGKKGELEKPVGIALDEARGRVYVVDNEKHGVLVFDMTEGTLLSTIGERGVAPGQFNYPTNIAVGEDGRLYVMDTLNFRVQILDPDGKVLKTFGEVGDRIDKFARPKGIALDSDGNIYVVDAAFNNFRIFDPEGRLMLFVGDLGPLPGQFWLPAGAYIDARDRLYIADQYNYRVQVFQYLGQDDRLNVGDESTPVKPETSGGQES